MEAFYLTSFDTAKLRATAIYAGDCDLPIHAPAYLGDRYCGKVVRVGRHGGVSTEIEVALANPDAIRLTDQGVISYLILDGNRLQLADYAAARKSFDLTRNGVYFAKRDFTGRAAGRDFWGFDLAKTASHGQHRNRLRSILHSV